MKECKLLGLHSAAKQRALCASAKSAAAVAGICVYVFVYDHVYISQMVYCHTGHTKYMKIYIYIHAYTYFQELHKRGRACVCV